MLSCSGPSVPLDCELPLTCAWAARCACAMLMMLQHVGTVLLNVRALPGPAVTCPKPAAPTKAPCKTQKSDFKQCGGKGNGCKVCVACRQRHVSCR